LTALAIINLNVHQGYRRPLGQVEARRTEVAVCRPKLGFSAIDRAEHEVDCANHHDLVVID
jgi:hypothetical protein